MTLVVVVATETCLQTPILVAATSRLAMEAFVAVAMEICLQGLLQTPSEVAAGLVAAMTLSAVAGIWMGMHRFLQIPSAVASVPVEAERIHVVMGIGLRTPISVVAMMKRILPHVPLTDRHAAASIPWTLLSSYHQYLLASNEYTHTIFVPLIHCYDVLHCIMLVNHL